MKAPAHGWVDTHCHLAAAEFDSDRDVVLQRARAAGVQTIVAPGVDLPSSRASLRLAEEHAFVLAAVGIHPHAADQWNEPARAELRRMARSRRVVAIGEIGLDYARPRVPLDQQDHAFREQLDLAADLGLPVILHHRESLARILEILEARPAARNGPDESVGGVLHAYSGDLASAGRAIALGLFLGVAGPITYPGAWERREVTSHLPLERLLVETDSPLLPPQPRRGQRNEPGYLPWVGAALARALSCPDELVRQETSRNALALFGLDHGTHHRDVL